MAKKALECFEVAGSRSGIARSLNNIGELARISGDLDTAEDAYRKALGHLEALDSGVTVYVQLNLGLVLLEREEFARAAGMCQRVVETCREQGRKTILVTAELALLASEVGLGRWDGWQGRLERATALLNETGYVDVDVPRTAERAGDLAGRTGKPAEARSAYELALTQWRALENEEKAREVSARIAALPSD